MNQKERKALLDAWLDRLAAKAELRDHWDCIIFGTLQKAEDWQEEWENMENGQ